MHFRRAVGRLVTLALRGDSVAPQGTESTERTPQGAGSEERTGRVTAVTADGIDLHVKGTKKRKPHTDHILFTDITKGVVQVEFSRPQSTPADTETKD